jgi:hypothetical protein
MQACRNACVSSVAHAAVASHHEQRKHMKGTIAILGILVAATLAATAFAAPERAAACVAGVKKISGVSARTFCGPAKATVHINGKTVFYKGGECSKSSFGWSINIGTVVLGNLRQKPEYFGTTAKASPGTQSNGAVAVVHAGKTLAVTGSTITLKPGLKGGTFSGKVFGASTRVTGSFTC